MSSIPPPSPPEKIRKILESETRPPKRWSPGPSCPTQQTPGIALMIILRMSWCVMWQGERYASHKIGRSNLEMFGIIWVLLLMFVILHQDFQNIEILLYLECTACKKGLPSQKSKYITLSFMDAFWPKLFFFQHQRQGELGVTGCCVWDAAVVLARYLEWVDELRGSATDQAEADVDDDSREGGYRRVLATRELE